MQQGRLGDCYYGPFAVNNTEIIIHMLSCVLKMFFLRSYWSLSLASTGTGPHVAHALQVNIWVKYSPAN